jgi:hypothetical protein
LPPLRKVLDVASPPPNGELPTARLPVADGERPVGTMEAKGRVKRDSTEYCTEWHNFEDAIAECIAAGSRPLDEALVGTWHGSVPSSFETHSPAGGTQRASGTTNTNREADDVEVVPQFVKHINNGGRPSIEFCGRGGNNW